jgi:FkbM family methyltransferase
MSIRSLAETLSRGVVLKRRLPKRFGSLPLYVTPEAGLRYWGPMAKVDPVLYEMAEELAVPGAVVWDIGANVGLFSFCASARAGTKGLVLSVEPDLWLAGLLTRSVHAFPKMGSADVEVLCASISDSNRVSKLEIAQRARASNHLIDAIGSNQAAGSRALQPTVTVTLDFLLNYFPPPNVLKIDAETHEVSILRGAERLLREVQPVIWCEVSAENSIAITELLQAADYELQGAAVRPHPLIKRAWFHTLAVPRRSARTDRAGPSTVPTRSLGLRRADTI